MYGGQCWNAIRGTCQLTDIAEPKDYFVDKMGDLPQEFIDIKAIVSFCNRL